MNPAIFHKGSIPLCIARRIGILFACCGFLVACSSTEKKSTINETLYNWNRPLNVAILPFAIDDNAEISNPESIEPDLDNLRKDFYSAFSTLPFEDVELSEIDQFLESKSISTEDIVSGKVSLTDLGKQMNVDLFLLPTLEHYTYTMALVYERWGIGFRIAMIDAVTGQTVLRENIKDSKSQRHMPISISGAAMEVLSIANRDDIEVEVIQEACHKLVEKLPSITPETSIYIDSLSVENANKPFRNGDHITITLKGAPRFLAECSLGDTGEAIHMAERSRGIYQAILKLEKYPDGPLSILACLHDRLNESEAIKEETSALIIDNTPPEPPHIENVTVQENELKERSILIKWNHPNVDDVFRYRIYRRDPGQDSFNAISTIRNKLFYVDQNTIPYTRYQYALKAIDSCGNESILSESESIAIINKGPFLIEGEDSPVPHDFFKESSPYIIRKNVVISRNTELAIEPGTEIILNGGSLWIEGTLICKGTPKEPIIFRSAEPNGNQALFLAIDSHSILEHSRFQNFFHALNISAKESEISNCYFSNNSIAISMNHGSHARLEQCNLEENDTGIHIGNGSTVNISESNLVGNLQNIKIEEGGFAKAEDNWWGKTDGLEHLSSDFKIVGNSSISRCLDAPSPEGHSIALKQLPLLSEFKETQSDLIRMDIAKKIIEQDPHYKAAYIWLIDYLLQSYRNEDALTLYEKLKAIYPNDTEVESLHEKITKF